MSDYTAAEVGKAIEDAIESNEDGFYWDEIDYCEQNISLRGEEFLITALESDTGGEGHGEYVYVVLQVGDQAFKKSGAYFSHYGTDWDGPLTEVTLVEKTIKVWEAKK